MIITAVNDLHIVVALDLVQAKYITEVLRRACEDAIEGAAAYTGEQGVGKGEPMDVIAAIHSFAEVVGAFTDRIGKPVPQGEVLPVSAVIN